MKHISVKISLLVIMLYFSPIITKGGSTMFEGKTAIGNVKLPCSVEFNSADNTYKITGSGLNMWTTVDAFYYVWNKVEGDLSLKMKYSWIGEGKQLHRKAGWMIRAGLDADAPYVDAVIHGDGLISMQYRTTKGGETFEVQSPIKGPAALIFERTGNQFTAYVDKNDGKIHPIGTITIEMSGQIYAGLAVCSHDSTTQETAVFSNVEMKKLGVAANEKRVVESTLEILDVETGIRTIVRKAKEHFEAPNWSPDGKLFYYNAGGKIYTLPVEGGSPKLLNTTFAVQCNNDHGISPDGKEFAISNHIGAEHKSMIYVLPIKGGEPKLITKNGPSYWHGWSPDGKTLAYCAERNGNFDVYTISVTGGEETRLTTTKGLDDGPEYSPDGKYIYFNSVRTGQMKIWRMKNDGSEQTQITPVDTYGDWFAHISPDNKSMVFVSYDKSVDGHPTNQNVLLRMMPVGGSEIKVIARLFGGQGTINVPSWSPDSKKFAFVSYRLVTP
jgi:Tol biopolymer transport system component